MGFFFFFFSCEANAQCVLGAEMQPKLWKGFAESL